MLLSVGRRKHWRFFELRNLSILFVATTLIVQSFCLENAEKAENAENADNVESDKTKNAFTIRFDADVNIGKHNHYSYRKFFEKDIRNSINILTIKTFVYFNKCVRNADLKIPNSDNYQYFPQKLAGLEIFLLLLHSRKYLILRIAVI